MAKFNRWWPLVTWPLTWSKKWPNQFRHDFWRSFECRLPRVATWPRSRVKRGVFKHPTPRGPARSAPSSGPARVKVIPNLGTIVPAIPEMLHGCHFRVRAWDVRTCGFVLLLADAKFLSGGSLVNTKCGHNRPSRWRDTAIALLWGLHVVANLTNFSAKWTENRYEKKLSPFH